MASGLTSITLLVLLKFICDVNGSGVRCKSCPGVPKMEDCAHIVTCGDNEECYTKKTVGTVGNVMYESGCVSKNVCSLISHSGTTGKRDELHDRHRRDFVNCFQCCNSDICNRHLCNTKPPVASTNKECFSCGNVLKPSECTELKSCGPDYQCSAVRYLLSTVDELRYRLGCMRRVACNASMTEVTKDGFCVRCCDENYCNTQLCGFMDTAKPIFSLRPQDRTVLPNDSVTLHCEVLHIGGLPFTITWTHEDANRVVTNPPIRLENENQVVKMTITKEHYGYWTCTANNKNGSSKQTVRVLPPIPNFGG